ncbi:hypothetical protein [Burkholderia glumae]|uniref:hypothetical protein n=1 Tax=Burkholderia glumae TaxID=337 RepID=UPI003B9C50CE
MSKTVSSPFDAFLVGDLPSEFVEAVRSMYRRDLNLRPWRDEREVCLNPIPCAIAGISADEWAKSIDRIEFQLTEGGSVHELA